MALSHRTYPSFISAMSSKLCLSPKCVQLVMVYGSGRMWLRRTYSFCCPGNPTDVSLPPSLPGWQPVPSALGWMSAMHATAACDHSGVVLLGGCCISLDCNPCIAKDNDPDALSYALRSLQVHFQIIGSQRSRFFTTMLPNCKH